MDKKRAAEVGKLFLDVIPTLTPFALAFCLSVSQLETNLGSKGNNFGSVYDPNDDIPCNPPNWQVKDPAGWEGCLMGYTTPRLGAVSFLKTLLKPNVREALKNRLLKLAVWAARENSYFMGDRDDYLSRVNVHFEESLEVAESLLRPPPKGNSATTALAVLLVLALGVSVFLYSDEKETKPDEKETKPDEKENEAESAETEEESVGTSVAA